MGGLRGIDMFRKIPADLTSATTTGAILSVAAYAAALDKVSGFVLVNRVPGNFHIEARSAHHEINAALANVSHVVNHLSFGAPVPPKLARSCAEIDQ